MSKQKYWYVLHIEMCPVCGHEKEWRERVYKKPDCYYQVEEYYDWCDVM